MQKTLIEVTAVKMKGGGDESGVVKFALPLNKVIVVAVGGD